MLQHPNWFPRLSATILAVFCVTYSGLLLTAPLPPGIAPPVIRPLAPSRDADTPPAAPLTWPPVFGAEAIPPTPIKLAQKQDIPFEVRGIIIEASRHWALIDGTSVARVGDVLRGGYKVVLISRSGIEVLRDGTVFYVPSIGNDLPDATGSPPSAAEESAASTNPVTEVEAFLGQVTPQTVARAFVRGGTLGPIDTETEYATIKWVRPNQLYDIVGLRQGDVIMTVNGQTVAEGKLTRKTLENAVDTGTIQFEILEKGEARKRVLVRLR